MPNKPRTPCHYRNCANLCPNGEYYCDEHKDKARKEYEHYHRGYKPSERYGYTWRKIRQAYVQAHPLCEECLKKGILTPVQEVHHIVPLGEGGTNDFSNLMSLCKSCHSAITLKANNTKN
jgi:5-methylcytosine-specific restriction protein A